jgi:hypothetical protein
MILSVLMLILAVLGLFIITWFLIGLLWNIIQGLRAFLFPSLQTKPTLDLKEKFGTWAGEFGINFLYLLD